MQQSPDAPLDFSKLDAIVAEAEAHGRTILPILYWPPKWAQPIYEHLAVRHHPGYGGGRPDTFMEIEGVADVRIEPGGR